MVTLFTCLIVLQFLIIVSHDLIDVPGLVHGSQVQAQIGKRRVWRATLANSVFPGVAVAFAIYFWNRPKPGYVPNYWVIYCSMALLSALGMWYIPYLRGARRNKGGNTSRCMRAPATSCLHGETIPAPISSMWASTSCSW